MSRYIDPNKPLTEEDVEFLKTRSGGEHLIELNEQRFGHLDEDGLQEVSDQVDEDNAHDAAELEEIDDEDGFDDDVIDRVAPLDYQDLRQAAAKLKLGGDGTKEELQDKLLNYYQDQKDSEQGKAKAEIVKG